MFIHFDFASVLLASTRVVRRYRYARRTNGTNAHDRTSTHAGLTSSSSFDSFAWMPRSLGGRAARPARGRWASHGGNNAASGHY